MTEPFMTRDFADRLETVRRHGVPLADVITNGTLLNEDSVAKILDAELSRFIFSIDGGTKAVYEGIRVGAVFERVIENFKLLQTRRRERNAALPKLRINHVLSEANIDHFEDFLALIESLEPEEIAVRTVSRMSDAEIQESSDPVFWNKVRAARVKLAAFCLRTSIEDSAFLRDRHALIELFADSGEKLICTKPWNTLAIHPNGDVFPCMAWSRPPIGNLLTETFNDIWRGEKLEMLRSEFGDVRPGLDCLHCTIRRAEMDPDDDFFYRKLATPFAS
jgi:radical SAM protein with 4Fe4S-binding SPASM domain